MSFFKKSEKTEKKIVKAVVKTKDCIKDGVEKNVDGAKELFAQDKPGKAAKKKLLKHESITPIKQSINDVSSDGDRCCSCF
jgi:hypothetical protein